MISVEEACERIFDAIPQLSTERLPLVDCRGRILQQDVPAERDAPPFDRVMMDGYAIAHAAELPELFLIKGIALAGHESPQLKDKAHCIEVTTGCSLPDGCDTVIPVEQCMVEGETMRLMKDCSVSSGQYIHRKGSDQLSGSIVLRKGARINAPEMAVLASENVMELMVSRMPRIGLVTTGDEVVHDGSKLSPEQIRGSHFPALGCLFNQFPEMHLRHQHAMDDDQDLSTRLGSMLEQVDILLITGGVSMGRKDLVPGLLDKLGVKEILHRVAQRPGKPLWFGKRDNQLVFGLPGNPISSLVCARRYVFPVMEKWMGGPVSIPFKVKPVKQVESLNGMTRFVPVCLTHEGVIAEAFATSGSLHNLAGTDGFIEMPPCESEATTFNFYPWSAR